jgi:hypothetical protein
MTIRPLIYFWDPFEMFGVFLYFFRGKNVGPFLYYLRAFLYFLGEKSGGNFVFF